MQNLEHIDDYFQGKLLPPEKAVFEQRIIEDPTFAEEVAFYSSAMQAAKEQSSFDQKKRFREIYYQHGNNSTHLESLKRPLVKRLWPVISVAAVMATLMLGFYLFAKPDSPRQRAEHYVQTNLNTLGIQMNGIEDSMQRALGLYNRGELTESLNIFESIARNNKEEIGALRYAGIVFLRLKNYDKALPYFVQLERYPGLYSNPGKFYHALTLMLRDEPGDKTEAKKLLQEVVEKDLEEKETAERWLKNW